MYKRSFDYRFDDTIIVYSLSINRNKFPPINTHTHTDKLRNSIAKFVLKKSFYVYTISDGRMVSCIYFECVFVGSSETIHSKGIHNLMFYKMPEYGERDIYRI